MVPRAASPQEHGRQQYLRPWTVAGEPCHTERGWSQTSAPPGSGRYLIYSVGICTVRGPEPFTRLGALPDFPDSLSFSYTLSLAAAVTSGNLADKLDHSRQTGWHRGRSWKVLLVTGPPSAPASALKGCTTHFSCTFLFQLL